MLLETCLRHYPDPKTIMLKLSILVFIVYLITKSKLLKMVDQLLYVYKCSGYCTTGVTRSV